MTFSLSEAPGLMMLPTPRAVAEELEAPYSVIMDAKNITQNKQPIKKYGNNRNKERFIELRAKGWSFDKIAKREVKLNRR